MTEGSKQIEPKARITAGSAKVTQRDYAEIHNRTQHVTATWRKYANEKFN